jgi:hypothetical protein
MDEYTIGLSKYLYGHKVKLQTDSPYDNVESFGGNVENNWYVRFQVEIGI